MQAPKTWKTLTAFAIIYLVWGSTFLAIRIGVAEVPPLLFAAIRFATAGLAVCAWAFARRQTLPRKREWLALLLLSVSSSSATTDFSSGPSSASPPASPPS